MVEPALNVRVSPATTAVPSVAVVLKVTVAVGVLSFVSADTATVGVAGATVSSTLAWATETADTVVATLMAVDAEEIAVIDVTALPKSVVKVAELARLTLAAALTWVARLATNVVPAPEVSVLASDTMVAICAADFCAASAAVVLAPLATATV